MATMNPFYIPTSSPGDWRKLLASPETQWREGYSAKELAECWEAANGFPPEFRRLFEGSGNPALRNPELLLAIPEYKVPLPGGGAASQNDLFVLARTEDGALAAMMVEGKVSESFGPKLDAWLEKASEGKRRRLEYLCDEMGLPHDLPGHVRYQLIHRTASAVLMAKRFNAAHAMMMVHSFSPEHRGFADFEAFLTLFGVEAGVGRLAELRRLNDLRLYAGWVSGKMRNGG
jgi:hypothetical protein